MRRFMPRPSVCERYSKVGGAAPPGPLDRWSLPPVIPAAHSAHLAPTDRMLPSASAPCRRHPPVAPTSHGGPIGCRKR
eukprot:701520-Prorocentrum_minimum.AAC.1